MALSSRSVKEAREILWKLFPETTKNFDSIDYGDDDEALQENTVLGYDQKSDGGYENVFVNVRNIQKNQIDEFNQLAEQIPNSTFCKELKDAPGITRIGWF